MRIAAVQPDRMGDVMFSWPILAKLKACFSAETTLFIHEESAPLLSLCTACPAVDVVKILPRGANWQNDPPRRLKEKPQFSKFDLVFNFTHLPMWPSMSATNFRDQDRHMIDLNAYQASEVLGEVWDLKGSERVLPIRVFSPKEQKLGRGYLALACWSRDGRRNWELGLWEKLVSALGLPAYMIGAPGEKCPRGVISLAGQTSTYEYAQIVQDAKLFISVETFCTSMLAEALGTPIVKIHNFGQHVFNLHPLTVGPGDPKWKGWRFTTAAAQDAYSRLDDVVDAARDLLQSYDKEEIWVQNRYLRGAL